MGIYAVTACSALTDHLHVRKHHSEFQVLFKPHIFYTILRINKKKYFFLYQTLSFKTLHLCYYIKIPK